MALSPERERSQPNNRQGLTNGAIARKPTKELEHGANNAADDTKELVSSISCFGGVERDEIQHEETEQRISVSFGHDGVLQGSRRATQGRRSAWSPPAVL